MGQKVSYRLETIDTMLKLQSEFIDGTIITKSKRNEAELLSQTKVCFYY